MRILILGAAGFLGQKLIKALAMAPSINNIPISSAVLADLHLPPQVESPFPISLATVDIADQKAVKTLLRDKPDLIFHLAGVMSGAAEADFALGLQVNLFGGLNLLEAARQAGNHPKIIFASSVAVHGGEAPAHVVDGVAPNPQSSYGTQKAMLELALNDYARRGFITGCALRLPTVIIRPGAANAAASSFMSSIFRDTLQGNSANCPVPWEFELWHSAPRVVIRNLIHAAGLCDSAWGQNHVIDLPGRTDSIGTMIDAMSLVAGPKPTTRITWNPEPAIQAIVGNWRSRFSTAKGRKLGFQADKSFSDSVEWFLEDDFDQTLKA